MISYFCKAIPILILSFTLNFILSESVHACDTSWIYRQYQSCQDHYDPIFKSGISQKICGSHQEAEKYRDHKFKSCAVQAHGKVDRYFFDRRTYVEPLIGEVRHFCTNSLPRYRVDMKLGPDYHLVVEAAVRTINERRTALAVCRIVTYAPIYRTTRSKHCGPEPYKTRMVSKPSSCRAPKFGLESTPNRISPHCPLETGYKVAQKLPAIDPIESQISEVQCLTCDSISEESKLQVNRKLSCLLGNLKKLRRSNGSINQYKILRQKLERLSQDHFNWILPRFKDQIEWNQLQVKIEE